ncbi:MAG: family 20 glycosylhydrolase [Muribaculaceae bacterium]
MKQLTILLSVILASFAAEARVAVQWETLGNTVDERGQSCYTERLTIDADHGFKYLGFNTFHRGRATVAPSDSLIEVIPGYYLLSSPEFERGGRVVVDIRTSRFLRNVAYVPDGFHVVNSDGTTEEVDFTAKSIIERPEQWQLADGIDLMPYGDTVFARNSELQGGRCEFYAVVPSYKSVTLTGATSQRINKIEFKAVDAPRAQWWRATVRRGTVTVEAAAEDSATVMRRLEPLNLLTATNVPEAVIEDYPDFGYRGIMIDIARNFQPISEMHRILQLMSRYGFNVLHFHFADDEAWRLEIPDFPELTEVCGRRGFTTDEHDHLAQLFTGTGDVNAVNSSNGYYTRSEFIGLLKYADSLGISVLPEIESPGHARAAIVAMEHRYRLTGDDYYRLIDPQDTSRYVSAQWFGDNVMNPALPGPVRFMTDVTARIKAMYNEAGVEMPAMHIGGDEVAMGAWTGSPIANAYMTERGLTNHRDLHYIFVKELTANFAAMGVKVSGWQEISMRSEEDFNATVRPNTFSINCWRNPDNNSAIIAQTAMANYPTVLSIVNHFYLDMCYSSHPDERGLTWGGTVDEFDALHGYPYELCPTDSAHFANVIGISGHLFAETVRSGRMIEAYLLPKMLGMAERAWNARPTYSDADFNAVLCTREMPYWLAFGSAVHLRQPGIEKMADGRVEMNTPYTDMAGVEVRYTLDGSEPTAESPLYTAPIATAGAAQVRAAIYWYGRRSVTTILNL